MAREEEIKREALFNCNDIAGEVDYKSTAAYEGFIQGAEWADEHPNGSIIKWQTGEPKEDGSYIITTDEGTVALASFSHDYSPDVEFFEICVTAWCKLSDIHPYKGKEETK